MSGRRGQAVLRVARILLVSTPLSPGLWAVSGAAVRAPIEIEVVVERGTPAPGLGDTFLSPTSTFLGAHGSLAFEASLFDAQDPYLGDAVAIAGPDGSLELVAKAGDPAPAGGGTIEQLEVFGFNGAGQLLLRAVLAEDPLGVRFFGPGPGGPLDLLAYDGGPAPGLGPGDVFYLISPPYLFGDDGSFAFESLVEIGGVVSTGNWGFWKSAPGTGLEVLFLPGDPAPGIPGRTLSAITDIAMDASGSLALFALLDNSELVLFVTDGLGGFTPVFSSLDPAPGVPGAHVCSPNPAISGTAIALESMLCESNGSIYDPPYGIWAGGPGGFFNVALQGEQAPGFPPGYTFQDRFGPPLPSASGTVAFTARVAGPRVHPDFDRGLWAFDPSTGLRLVAFPGMKLPDRRRGFLLSVKPLGVNSRGDVAFSSELSNGGRGLHVAFAGTNGFLTVVAKGDEVELSPGRSVKVKNVFVSTPPALPPGTGARVFDDERRLAFGLGFARGHHAALLARPLPEPSRPLLVLVGAALLGVVRRAAAKRRS